MPDDRIDKLQRESSTVLKSIYPYIMTLEAQITRILRKAGEGEVQGGSSPSDQINSSIYELALNALTSLPILSSQPHLWTGQLS